jgi:hypothetical protein
MKNFPVLAFLALVFTTVSFAQDSPLKILELPKPELPKNYGTLDAQGTVRLKVEFLADGEIGNILAITKMPVAKLTELAEGAARTIRFEPEINGGNKIVSTRIIEYLYSPNGFWKSPMVLALLGDRQTRDDQAEAIIAKVVAVLGGEKYLKVTSQIGRGKFSVVREGAVVSFQSFTDIIVFPDKERTDFKGSGSRTTQTNVGDTGWIFDGDKEAVTEQSEEQVANFKRGMRASLDTLLRGNWRGKATLTYAGKRPATLGKRNDVVKLTYTDGLVVEFEIGADDSIPVKAIQRRKNVEGQATEDGKEPAEIVEEDRYAQFVDIDGIKSPFIIDRFTGGVQTSRINYQSVEYNKRIPDSIFAKPSTAKEAKKDPKF